MLTSPLKSTHRINRVCIDRKGWNTILKTIGLNNYRSKPPRNIEWEAGSPLWEPSEITKSQSVFLIEVVIVSRLKSRQLGVISFWYTGAWQGDVGTMSWLRWKAENILRRKEAICPNATLSLFKSRKGYLQDKAVRHTPRRDDSNKAGNLVSKHRKSNIYFRFTGQFLIYQKSKVKFHGVRGECTRQLHTLYKSLSRNSTLAVSGTRSNDP